ncbi:MAG: histidine ammonia-lyase, partial [Bacteroidetes bacterium]|nr:histidine ammonia-lyase [Bacteroidota bacterium]
AGMGEEVPTHIVKTMILLKVLGLSKGNSGITLETISMLIEFYNQNVLPVIYTQGSLGASGDLAPLAHLSLALIGHGEVSFNGVKRNASDVLQEVGLNPINLQSKEGLALLNGTQFMSSYALTILANLENRVDSLEKVAALSLDAYDGRIEPFYEAVHALRPHPGQVSSAAAIQANLEGSEWITRRKEHVQDPYSFRCIPQVHGASKDAIDYARRVVEIEINSVTDNPTLIPEDNRIISAGNFHGQPLALTLDFLSIAMAELGSISERRTYKLVSGNRGLPAYLVANPGLNSGFMIVQYTAASIVSQNKQLCTPASVDTIDSSNGQEDHVSMGANAATKAMRVFENLEKLIGIELMTAAQAADFREGKSSSVLEELRTAFRKEVPFIKDDDVMSKHMHVALRFVQ